MPGSKSENRHRFFKPSPASNASSPPMRTSTVREVIVDSEASLHMMSINDLAPEEQETNRKPKQPSVIMTASGTTQTTEEATTKTSIIDRIT